MEQGQFYRPKGDNKNSFLAVIIVIPLLVFNTLFTSFAILKVFQWFIFPAGLVPVFGMSPICGFLLVKAFLSYNPSKAEAEENVLKHVIYHLMFCVLLLGVSFILKVLI